MWLFIFYLFIFISIFISIAGKKVLHTIARLSAEILLIIFVSIEYPTKLLVDLFHTCIFLDKGRQVYVKGHVGDTVNSFSRFDHPCVTPESSTMKVSVWCLVTSLIWLLIYFCYREDDAVRHSYTFDVTDSITALTLANSI